METGGPFGIFRMRSCAREPGRALGQTRGGAQAAAQRARLCVDDAAGVGASLCDAVGAALGGAGVRVEQLGLQHGVVVGCGRVRGGEGAAVRATLSPLSRRKKESR